jgi:ectoine hydroxylase-related dioxygenase (phytanoyl-CoA dioxygenase family)
VSISISYGLRVRLNGVRARFERDVRRVVFGGRPTWKRRPNTLPWLDQADALGQIDRTSEDTDLLEKWVGDGYVVVRDCVDPGDIDAMVATLDGLWDASEAILGLELLGLREAMGEPERNLSHGDVLRLDPDMRRRLRDASDWRIHGFHYVDEAARRIYFNRKLRRIASRLLGRRARPIAAINFMSGSEQALHQDMAVFHIYPHNYLVGAWIACEDIAADSGPLVIYPGSHRAPLFSGFTDYPQTNLRTADTDGWRRYQEYVDGLSTHFERKEFHARKGEVLLWHGMVIHGGAPITRRGVSRKSMVLHYSVRGADRGREVVGPFNW